MMSFDAINSKKKYEINRFSFFQANELFARAALHCLSTLTLRSTENSQALFDVGAAETIVETMKLHTKSKIVLVKLDECALRSI